ncbi:tetratricopeptide repeat protein [Specibacter cremeus]|uniref:tetratricopeptide repeat protein n=1 Tax=Specibacter cremeus TaxID=1629051 RepID=UPI000F7818C3|nr:tetratricopeptide repeat protein [Specibacter cremeus]
MTIEYYDLGTHSWPISTTSPTAQQWFDRGLIWMYGFNHEEAIACFTRAIEADPECAMAYWGVAYAVGPNYNKPWGKFDPTDLSQSLATAEEYLHRALALAETVTEPERLVIQASTARYQGRTAGDFAQWNADYARAMGAVYERFPDDVEIAALYADSAMNVNAREFWKKDGLPGVLGGLEIQYILERALEQPGGQYHPGALHLYIHAMECSPYPERALPAADRLRGLVPDAGHLNHMPSHIDGVCGDYVSVLASNSQAVLADRKWLEREGNMNFYTLYRLHNLHFKIFGSMMLGQSVLALEAANEMAETIPESLLRVEVPPMADWLEGSVSMRLHVLIRFGRWQEIIDTPLPADQKLYCVTTAMTHYAKGVAYAATGRIEDAEREKHAFYETVPAVPPTREVFETLCVDLLTVAAAMLEGEIEYRKGNYEVAFDHLRNAVAINDALRSEEPWGQMQPPRHALGALLLEQGHYEEAEDVYRTDLGLNDKVGRMFQRRNNLWSLHGLRECLMASGRHGEAGIIAKQFEFASARADVPIKASCCCRTTAFAAV